MTSQELLAYLERFWRVPVVGLVAGVLAFGGSFLVSPNYEAETKLLVRGRSATLLTTTGQDLANAPGVIDSTMATALSATQSGLLTSRTVAEMVVDDLGLDGPRPEDRSIGKVVRGMFSDLYRRARAYATHGFYAEPEPRAAAIGAVYEGLSARQLKDSYVLELTATAESGPLAAAIANSAANALVEVSRGRFREEADAHRDFLSEQLDLAAAEEDAALRAVQAFKEQHGIDDVNVAIYLGSTSAMALREQLRESEVSLLAARAELSAVKRSLAGIDPTDSTVSEIETGRSTTRIQERGASGVYQELRTTQELLEARVASLEARRDGLQAALEPDGASGLSEEEAGLRQLELRHALAADAYSELSGRYHSALVNSASDQVEITRVDAAAPPLYPASPNRLLYLGMGGIVGGIAGLLLTYFALGRRGLALFPEEPAEVSGAPEGDGERELALAGATRTSAGRFELFSGPPPGMREDIVLSDPAERAGRPRGPEGTGDG